MLHFWEPFWHPGRPRPRFFDQNGVTDFDWKLFFPIVRSAVALQASKEAPRVPQWSHRDPQGSPKVAPGTPKDAPGTIQLGNIPVKFFENLKTQAQYKLLSPKISAR